MKKILLFTCLGISISFSQPLQSKSWLKCATGNDNICGDNGSGCKCGLLENNKWRWYCATPSETIIWERNHKTGLCGKIKKKKSCSWGCDCTPAQCCGTCLNSCYNANCSGCYSYYCESCEESCNASCQHSCNYLYCGVLGKQYKRLKNNFSLGLH